ILLGVAYFRFETRHVTRSRLEAQPHFPDEPIEGDRPEGATVAAHRLVVPFQGNLRRSLGLGHALHEETVREFGVSHHDEVAATRRTDPVGPPVHEDVVPRLQRRSHALVFDPEPAKGEHRRDPRATPTGTWGRPSGVPSDRGP